MPTRLAIAWAEAAGLTLIGRAREGGNLLEAAVEAAREQILGRLNAELEEEKAIRVKAMTEKAIEPSSDGTTTASGFVGSTGCTPSRRPVDGRRC